MHILAGPSSDWIGKRNTEVIFGLLRGMSHCKADDRLQVAIGGAEGVRIGLILGRIKHDGWVSVDMLW